MLGDVERSKYIHQWYATYTDSEALVELGLVTFESKSQGQLAMIIYEWCDYKYLGKVTSEIDEYLPVSFCTSGFAARSYTLLAEDVCMHLRRRARGFLRFI